MPIEFDCPACQTTLRAEADAAGKPIRCGHCLTVLRVPTPPGGGPPAAPLPVAEPAAPPPRRRDRRDDEFDDDFDRPRRRRRREPETGGRTVRRVLVGSLLAALLIALVCGGIIVFAEPRWREYDSPAGGYRVQFPGEPQADAAAGVPVPAGATVEAAAFTARAEIYAVAYRDLTPAERGNVTADEFLDAAVKQFKAEHPGFPVSREGPVTVGGVCPGREVVIQAPGHASAWRVVIAGNRVYTLVVQGPWADPDGDRTRTFFDSFAVTDEAVLAAAREQLARDEGRRRLRAAQEATRKFFDGVKKSADEMRAKRKPGPLRGVPAPPVGPPPDPRPRVPVAPPPRPVP